MAQVPELSCSHFDGNQLLTFYKNRLFLIAKSKLKGGFLI